MADGLTKPLLGQSFMAFGTGGGSAAAPHVAAMSLAGGSMLLSGVGSEDAGDETEFDAIWACGATLMALGAI